MAVPLNLVGNTTIRRVLTKEGTFQMKRWISGSLLVLSSSFLVARASAHSASLSGGPSTLTPISLSRLQTLVRQTLGQQAVDHMGQLVTQPLSTHTSAPVNLSFHHAGGGTSSQLRANTQERVSISNRDAGYWVNAEGASWVQGPLVFFCGTTSRRSVGACI